MLRFKKTFSLMMAFIMIITVISTAAINSNAADEVVYSFSSSNWNWWGTAQGNEGGWGQNDSALTRNYSDGAVTYDVSGKSATVASFNQIQDKWKSLPAGDLYFNFTNNTAYTVTVKIDASTTLFETAVSANSTKKIEFTNPTTSDFSIFVMNWSVNIPGGTGLFTFSSMYKQPDEEATTATTASSEYDVVFPLIAANHNYSKTEGCNPNNNWAWGSFATTTFTYNSDGSADVNVTAGDYDKFRQLNSNWKNVPATTDTTYIDITNNAGRLAKVKIAVGGYTTPADSALPTVASGETLTVELGQLTGGSLQVLILDAYGSDALPCKDSVFKISGIYKKAAQVVNYTVSLDGNELTVPAGGDFELPSNDATDFVGYYDGTNLYNAGEYIEVNSDITLTTISLSIKMISGASIRFSNPSGMRFYTEIDKDSLAAIEQLGATVQLGTLISPIDIIGTQDFTTEMTGQYADVKFNVRNWFEEDTFSGFVGSIVKIKQGNLNRKFVGRGYATITLGDFSKTIYADYSNYNISDNTRTICEIAVAIRNSQNYNSLGTDAKRIVDDLVDSYIA